MPRHPDPELEHRILEAASRLLSRGGPKAFTMRAVAKAAGTTTPTVYERFRDRDDILRGLRLKTRQELFNKLSRTSTLAQACQGYLEFALQHREAYGVLFDGIAQPPSLHEAWPSFNLFRQRLARRLGGTPRGQTRLMLSLWALMHGTAMLVNRGRAEGALRMQMFYACIDAFEAIIADAARSKGRIHSGPKWPANLILGEADHSQLRNTRGNHGSKRGRAKAKTRNRSHR